MQVHGSCAAREGAGVLFLGPPGSGKSDLVLRLLRHGFVLVADDRVEIVDLMASPPAPLAGLLEIRGVGIVRLPHEDAHLRLIVELSGGEQRLPEPARDPRFDLPVLRLDQARAASAPDRVSVALDCVLGTKTLLAGAL